ncbi:tetratricopeptide repeat protein [bacterium]|jgi:tetratricopeptide (TPR) repeat protein|nr:tetratricopeptide repeat protein [bacterium]
MPSALLVQYFGDLPTPREGEDFSEWRQRHFKATKRFKKQVLARYTEGTLIRLLDNKLAETRKAALFALGLLGTMEANSPMARLLHDGDNDVADMATASLWNLWFRADSEENNTELQKATRIRDREKALECMTNLINKAPDFAEALNQRAIIYFRMKQYEDSIADCQRALDLNPWHFGAQVGMAQSFMKMKKHRSALKAFRNTLKIHPRMEGVADAIRTLEKVLGEDGGGRKDDKK